MFAGSHPDSLIFHQPSWLQALRDVYGYEPVALVLEDHGAGIRAGWPFMIVRSRLTGSRLVSLPFSHHVGPLLETQEHAEHLLVAALAAVRRHHLGRLDGRGWSPRVPPLRQLVPTVIHQEHLIDLSHGPESVLKRVDKDMRYSIRRASREGVTARIGTPADSDLFYGLYVALRKKQGLLPQPRAFIEQIFSGIIGHDNGFLVVAEHGGRAVTALLSLGHGPIVVGSHSGSLPEARRLRAAHLALWTSVEEACRRGYQWYNLGRTDEGSAGLAHFKQGWGTEQKPLPYFTVDPKGAPARSSDDGIKRAALGLFVGCMPKTVIPAVSAAAYRHLG